MNTVARRFLLISGFGLTLGLIYASTGFAAGDPERGKHVYEKHCLLCHGQEGRGDGPQGKLMNPPAADFHAPDIRKKSNTKLLKTIKGGHPGTAMTGFEYELDKQQLNDVLSYIRKLGGPPDKGI